MYYADDLYYDDSYAYDDNKDDESYDVEDCYELCEPFDGICETKSVLRANQSANNDVLNVKAQSNVVSDVFLFFFLLFIVFIQGIHIQKVQIQVNSSYVH